MATCKQCGATVQDGIQFCPSCGAPVYAAGASATPGDLGAKLHQINDTADTTAAFDPADVQANKAMGILAYLSWLVLVPIFAAKNSPFARFHANQGLCLAIAQAAWIIVSSVITTILRNIPVIRGVWSLVGWLASVLFVVFAVLGIVNAAKGRAKELPLVGGFRILK